LLSWEIKNAQTLAHPGNSLPERILTFQPTLNPDRIPLEVSILLPTTSSNKALLDEVEIGDGALEDSAIGLFLTDYFINFRKTAATLKRAGAKWICNMPSVGMHDSEFKQYLSEVGMGVAKEAKLLSAFQQQGFRSLCVISSKQDVSQFAQFEFDAICVMPQISSFIAGFPSYNRRQEMEAEIFSELKKQGWTGTRLGYRQKHESDDITEPHLLRPTVMS